MGIKNTIKLSDKDKKFYKDVYLARKLQEWYEQYVVMYTATHDEENYVCRDEFVTNECADKDAMKYYLTYNQYIEYEKLYNEIYEIKGYSECLA